MQSLRHRLVRSRQSAHEDVLGFLRFGNLENGERVGTIFARLAVRLGDVWVTLVKTSTPYFSRRNRDLGTISVYVGYRDVRCLPPLCVHVW